LSIIFFTGQQAHYKSNKPTYFLSPTRSGEREKLTNCKVICDTICIAFCIAFFIGIPMVLVFFRLILHTDLQANLHYRINICGVANWSAFYVANLSAESLLPGTKGGKMKSE
jgi:hypothetical protein